VTIAHQQVARMELFIDNARSAKIVDDVRLPAVAKNAIRAYTSLRRRAEQEDRRAAVAARRAVRILRGDGGCLLPRQDDPVCHQPEAIAARPL
jgi:hypothetical protein